MEALREGDGSPAVVRVASACSRGRLSIGASDGWELGERRLSAGRSVGAVLSVKERCLYGDTTVSPRY